MDQDKDRTKLGTTGNAATGPRPATPAKSDLPTVTSDISPPVRRPHSSATITSPATPRAQDPHGQPTAVAGAATAITPSVIDPGLVGDLPPGQQLGVHVVRRKLAEGGMGVVYEAVHEKIGRRVAIKVLKPEFCRSQEMFERFKAEARAVNEINHENIVSISEYHHDGSFAYFVMEFLEGEPLSARTSRGPLTWLEALPILEQTLRALKAAHDKGYVHRDLKPDNIWLRHTEDRVQVKLLDFGIAKLMGSETPRDKLTRTGAVIGTPHYMSPEQISGSGTVDHRTDLYAIGVIVYELFTGVTPFNGDTLHAIIAAHLFNPPPKLEKLPPELGVPPAISTVVDRMLVKDPELRYRSAADVLTDLHDLHNSRTPTHAGVIPIPPPGLDTVPQLNEPLPPRVAPKRSPLWMIGGLAAVGLAIAALVMSQAKPAKVATTANKPTDVDPPRPPPPPPPPPVADDATLRKDALAVVTKSFADPLPNVRKDASDATHGIRDSVAIRALTELARNDPDSWVRTRAAYALAILGVKEAAPMLAELERRAVETPQVWYTGALARLGDKRAEDRLIRQTLSKDLEIAVEAGMLLGKIAQPGNRKAIAALVKLAGREAEMAELKPNPILVVLARGAALRDRAARESLYAIHEGRDEGLKLEAAMLLAELGDDTGRETLRNTLAEPGSPNQLAAAVALVKLGEYAGLDLMVEKLAHEDAMTRQLAARGLGDMGERLGLYKLAAAEADADGRVRVAAAAAVYAIVGLDAKVLAQASLDWTQRALESQDWAVRRAATGVISDLEPAQARPLLAKAFADSHREVRRSAVHAARRMKTREAAEELVAAMQRSQEKDPELKEEQVKALGAIGDPVGHDVLAEIAAEPGRIGVIASGALIAVGDTAGYARIEQAYASPQTELRLAAVEAASAANHPIVVPTLKLGLFDKLFPIRFIAAEGLANYNAERADAEKVLKDALSSKDANIVGRALAALSRFGAQLIGLARTPREMVESPDPKQRLAAIPAVRALPVFERVPLLRRLAGDPEVEVRRAAVDAIEDVVKKDQETEQALRLYRPLVRDSDELVRSKASAQLSRLTPPPPPPNTHRQVAARPPSIQVTVDQQLVAAIAAADKAAADAKLASDAVTKAADELKTALAATSADAADIERVDDLKDNLVKANANLSVASRRVSEATGRASDIAGDPVNAPTGPTAAAVPNKAAIEKLRDAAKESRAASAAAADNTTVLRNQADDFRKAQTPELQMMLDDARLQIDRNNFGAATKQLAAARKRGQHPRIDDLYGELYVKMARAASDPAQKRTHLQRAAAVYQRIAASGSGERAQNAADELQAINDELAQ